MTAYIMCIPFVCVWSEYFYVLRKPTVTGFFV